jgi:methylmalonyl-CoA mutase
MMPMTVDDSVFRRELSIADAFPDPALDDWRRLAERSLEGTPLEALVTNTHEGISLDALYHAGNSAAATLPRPVRGRATDAWEACQCTVQPDPEVAAAQVVADTEAGVDGAWLVFDRSCRLGVDPDDPTLPQSTSDGIIVATADHTGQLLSGLDPTRTAIHLGGGGNGFGVAATVLAGLRQQGFEPVALGGGLGLDPLGALAADGELCYGLEGSLDLLADAVAWTERSAPGLRAVSVSTLPYSLAGATAVQELSYALATGVRYLRSLCDGGTELETACRSVRFIIAVGRDLFMAVAKLRGLRQTWARVVEASGGSAGAGRTEIHALSSPRSMAIRDPWVNQLRATVEAFAAVAGGADALTVLPYDSPHGPSDEAARRIAALTHAILRDESQLHRVADPAGGSWYVERLTRELSEAAWSEFQRIEASGGMASALTDGTIRRRLADTLAAKRRAVAVRQDPITGVSSFPDLAERPLERQEPEVAGVRRRAAEAIAARVAPEAALARLRQRGAEGARDGSVMEAAIDAATQGATVAELAAAVRSDRTPDRITALEREREGEIFERLRDASDAWLDESGTRPRVFVAPMGSVEEHGDGLEFAANVLSAGGIEIAADRSFESVEEATVRFVKSRSKVAVVCASAESADTLVPELARSLKERGAQVVLVVASPGEQEGAWREAGVDGFLCRNCDVHSVLRDLLATEGWPP